MSLAASPQRSQWMVVTASIVVSLVGIGVVLTLSPPWSSPEEGAREAAPALPQAPWRIKAAPAGGRPATQRERALLDVQRARLARTIKTLYDALFLAPDALPAAARRTLTRASARSLDRTRIGAPAALTRIQTLRRRARLAIDARAARTAAASVSVVARGQLRGRVVRVRHDGTLWLERVGRSWRVIGFDVRQRPLR